jgi:hypothetical protein
MPWLRLDDTFGDHPKFYRLADKLGVSVITARGHMATLWAWCLRHCPDGDLSNYSPREISAIGAQFVCSDTQKTQNTDDFVAACIHAKLIDQTETGLIIHGWTKRAESWKSAERKRKERKKASRNVTRQMRDKTATVTEMSQPCPEMSHRPDQTRPDVPDQTRPDVPDQTTHDQTTPNQTGLALIGFAERKTSPAHAVVLSVFDHYRQYHQQAHKKPSPKSKEWKAIAARLSEGYTGDDLIQAIDGMHKSPFHMGENDRGKRYDSLELCMRDGSKVQQFIELAGQGTPDAKTEAERRRQRERAEWMTKMLKQHAQGDASA